MLALLVSSLVAVSYNFPTGKTLLYDMEVGFDGFLPVLGSDQATADLKMALEVGGLSPDAEGRPQAYSDLKEIEMVFNGAKLPFTVDNVKGFFPKTTVSLDPLGKVLKTDAPDVQLPIKLPGLDVKRFPEISYLPIEFPKEGVEEGKEWSFTRPFQAAPFEYKVTPTKVAPVRAEFAVSVTQSYEYLENEAHETVTDAKDAVASVKTLVTGTGKVVFDLTRQIATAVDVQAEAVSDVEDLKTHEKSKRKLKTTLKVRLREPKVAPCGYASKTLAGPARNSSRPTEPR